MKPITEQLIAIGSQAEAQIADAMRQNEILRSDLVDADKQIDELRVKVTELEHALKLARETAGGGQAPATGTVIFRVNGDEVKGIIVDGTIGAFQSNIATVLPVGTYVARRETISPGWVAEQPKGVPFTVEAGKSIEVRITTVTKTTPPPTPSDPVTPPLDGMIKPIKCESGKTYDGQGATIDASGGITAISLQGVSNVVVKNYKIANASGIGVDIWQSRGVTIENIEIVSGEPSHGVQVRQSNTVSIFGIVADIVSGYLVYGEDLTVVEVARCALRTGSRNETGMRFMGSLHDVIIADNTIRNWMNPIKCTALRVQGFGDNIMVRGGRYDGLSILGPMGEDQGGQLEKDPGKRKLNLDRKLTHVRSENVIYAGGLGLMAGLEANITGGQIIGEKGPVWKDKDGTEKCQNPSAYPIFKIGWRYPEMKHQKPGDPIRPAPVGTIRGVAFSSSDPRIKSLSYNKTNGPMKVIGCTLFGKPI